MLVSPVSSMVASGFDAGVGVPSGWAVAVPGGGVLYWDATALAFQSSCPATDGMLQKVTVRVTAPNGYVDKVDVVKRNPA